MTASLDRIDRLLLELLQDDGQLTNQALAERVSLSESACLRRVRRLEDSGLIRGYVALLDQTRAGYPDNVFVRITLKSQGQETLNAFESAARALPEVMECYLMSGDSDYLLRVIVSDARDYERLHSRALTLLPGVDRVHSSFALRTVVRRTQVPTHRLGNSG
ncbi:MAG: Lrp/AsnC family transcriptional regulator [Pseudomonadota bacterium]